MEDSNEPFSLSLLLKKAGITEESDLKSYEFFLRYNKVTENSLSQVTEEKLEKRESEFKAELREDESLKKEFYEFVGKEVRFSLGANAGAIAKAALNWGKKEQLTLASSQYVTKEELLVFLKMNKLEIGNERTPGERTLAEYYTLEVKKKLTANRDIKTVYPFLLQIILPFGLPLLEGEEEKKNSSEETNQEYFQKWMADCEDVKPFSMKIHDTQSRNI